MAKFQFIFTLSILFTIKSFASGLELPPAWELREQCRTEFSHSENSDGSSLCLVMVRSFMEGLKETSRQKGVELDFCEETSTSFEEYFLLENTENEDQAFGEFVWGYMIGRCQE